MAVYSWQVGGNAPASTTSPGPETSKQDTRDDHLTLFHFVLGCTGEMPTPVLLSLQIPVKVAKNGKISRIACL